MNREEFVLNVFIADASEIVAGTQREDGCGSAFLRQQLMGSYVPGR
jgi:hypothetical protein